LAVNNFVATSNQ